MSNSFVRTEGSAAVRSRYREVTDRFAWLSRGYRAAHDRSLPRFVARASTSAKPHASRPELKTRRSREAASLGNAWPVNGFPSFPGATHLTHMRALLRHEPLRSASRFGACRDRDRPPTEWGKSTGRGRIKLIRISRARDLPKVLPNLLQMSIHERRRQAPTWHTSSNNARRETDVVPAATPRVGLDHGGRDPSFPSFASARNYRTGGDLSRAPRTSSAERYRPGPSLPTAPVRPIPAHP